MSYEVPGAGSGYEVDETLARLKFPDKDGLDVLCSMPGLDELFAAAELTSVKPEKLTATDYAKVNAVIESFGHSVREWNLTRDGEPVPATADGVKSLPMKFRMELIEAWLTAASEMVAARANEKAAELSAGVTEAELPAETL